jgi:RNA polymerase sigma-70 factor (ECF subfamily)
MEPVNLGASTQSSAGQRVTANMDVLASFERDTELMLRVRDGCATSFAALLGRNRGPVIQFLFRMVQNRAVAEELAQEVFLRVYRSRATYEPTAKFATWMFQIASHVALNWIRDQKGEKGKESLDQQSRDGAIRQVLDRRPSVEQRLLLEAKFQEIRCAIHLLPTKQRAAVLMHKYREMDYSQIAETLKCSESAIKSLLFRAYESLRARLAHFA